MNKKRNSVILLLACGVMGLMLACGLNEFGDMDQYPTADPTQMMRYTQTASVAATLTAAARATQFAQSEIRPLGPPLEHPQAESAIGQVAFSPNGELLVALSGRKILLWNMTTREPDGVLEAGDNLPLSALSFSPDGRFLVAGACGASADGPCAAQVHLWDVSTRRLSIPPFPGPNTELAQLAMGAGGEMLAAVGRDQQVHRWNLRQGSPPQMLAAQAVEGGALALAFSPDGKYLASSGRGGRLSYWNGEDGHLLKTEPTIEPVNMIYFLAWTAEDLIAVTNDPILKIDFESGQTGQIYLPYGAPLPKETLAVTAEGHFLASGLADDQVAIYDLLLSWSPVVPLSPQASQTPVTGLAFSPDSHILAAVSGGRVIVLLDMSRPQ